jgi:transposase InsO family protein
MWVHPTPMFPVIIIVPFTKWGIDFTTCHPVSSRGHRYIIVAVDYFNKWVKAMLTFNNDRESTALFVFNQIVARFGIPKDIVIDHGSHFQNKMMHELTSNLGFKQENLSPYYPQENG